MSKQDFNLIYIICKNTFNLTGSKFFDISKRLLLKFIFKCDSNIFQGVISTDMRKSKSPAVKKCIQSKTDKDCPYTNCYKLKVRQIALSERNNQLIQKKIRNNVCNNSKRCKNRCDNRILFILTNIRSNRFNHKTFLHNVSLY